MASIIKKKKGKKAYYYAVQSGRVKGKPRIIWQKYLGSVDRILEMAEQNLAPIPTEIELFEAGAVSVLLSIEKKLNLIDLINKVTNKKQKGPSMGHYILLAALNRALEPKSKSQIGDWYNKTILKRLWNFPKKMFSSQRYWDHMDLISEQEIEIIQTFLFDRIKKEFSIQLQPIFYDTTNFFTYINTHNDRNNIAQRGNNKQKRKDLRQVNLALITTGEFQIPLFHKIYQGNIPDVSFFSKMSNSLMQKGILKNKNDATLVFDKGNFSEENIENLLYSNISFLGSAKASLIPDIFSTPMDKFKDSKLPGTKFYETNCEIYGKICKIVISYSESFFTKQLASLTKTMAKCQDKLQALQKSLSSKKRASIAKIKKAIDSILSSQNMKNIFDIHIEKNKETFFIRYSVNREGLDKLTSSCLGRTLLVTNKKDWSSEKIILSYRELSNIEEAFKHMKNREYLRWQPAYHWTDQKLNVHSFYCVLALLLVALARKTVCEAGIQISISKLLDELSSVKEVALLYKDKRKKLKAQVKLSKMSLRQKKILECFETEEILF